MNHPTQCGATRSVTERRVTPVRAGRLVAFGLVALLASAFVAATKDARGEAKLAAKTARKILHVLSGDTEDDEDGHGWTGGQHGADSSHDARRLVVPALGSVVPAPGIHRAADRTQSGGA